MARLTLKAFTMRTLFRTFAVILAATIFIISLPFQMVADGSEWTIEAIRKLGLKLS